MTFLLSSAARETTGARSGQEDAFRLWPADGVVSTKGEGAGLLAVLADGMGGHSGGEVAGQTACQTFVDVFSAARTAFDARLTTALHASNEALAKGVEQNAALRGMGCTLIAAWIDELGLRWTSVGDSLLLLYRLPDVIRLNADHSLGSFLDEQARQNVISRSEARRNRNRNALRSALTGSKIDLIDLRSEPLELRAGDWVVLASDGICSLDGDEIADVVYRLRQSSPEEMADGLIAAVKQKGVVDQDNTTVVAVRVEEAKAATDEVTTRIMMRPGRGDDADLRTRRIGVSRPLRHTSKSRRAAVWLATAAVLLISAAAIMVALPRQTAVSPPPDAAGAQQSTTATKAGVDAAPKAHPAKLPADPAPKSPPPSTIQERPASEGDDGAGARSGQPRGAAPRGPAATGPGRSGSEGEEGGGSRGTRSRTAPGASPKAGGESEEGAMSRPKPPKSSAVSPPPEAPPLAPVGEGEEIAPRPSPSKSSAAKPAPFPVPPTRSRADGEGGTPTAPRSAVSKSGDPNASAKSRSGGLSKPTAGPPATKPSTTAPAKPVATTPPKPDPAGEPPKPARVEPSPLEEPREQPWRTNSYSLRLDP
jgi:protein phosphatase